MDGGFVCGTHGGRAKQVKRAAAARRDKAAAEAAAARWAKPIETTAADAMRDVLWALNGLLWHYRGQLEKAKAATLMPGEWEDSTKALVSLYERTERTYFAVAAECRRANIDEARFELEASAFEVIDRMMRDFSRRSGLDPDAPEVAQNMVASLRLIAGGAA